MRLTWCARPVRPIAEIARELGIYDSTSCLDNAVAESWFASLKVELTHRQHYRTLAEARTAILAWIASYNRRPWLHSPGIHLPGGTPT